MNDVMTDGEISFVKEAFNIAMSELAERLTRLRMPG